MIKAFTHNLTNPMKIGPHSVAHWFPSPLSTQLTLRRGPAWLACWLMALGLSFGGTSRILAQPAPLVSSFTRKPPTIDGQVGWGEWQGAQQFQFQHGVISFLNDNARLYLLIDVLGQTDFDPNDYIYVTVDVDGDGKITPRRDLNFTLNPSTREIRSQLYLGPGEWTGLLPETSSGKGETFDAFLADNSLRADLPKAIIASRHRVWEVALDLGEIGSRAGGKVRLGIRVASPKMQYTEDLPKGFTRDFSSLIQVDLSRFLPLFLGDPNAVISLQAGPLEITQAVQNRQNTLPLVQDKTTVVRTYFNVSGTSAAQPVWVYLYGKRGGVDLPGSPLTKYVDLPITVDRTRLSDTPWFQLPASWVSGTVDFRVRFRTTLGAQDTSAATTVTFTPKSIPTFWVVPINTGSTASPTLVSDAEITSQQNFLRAMYPLPEVNFVRKSWTAVGATTVDNTITKLRDYYNQAAFAWILGVIFGGGPPFDLPTQIYGATPSGGGISDPVWCGGYGNVARGYRGTSLEGTMAHEINHNLDRDTSGTWGHHTPFGCGASGADPAWPYANANVQEVGFDTRAPIDADNVVPSTFPDIMSYCQSGASPTKWITPYRWNNLFTRFPTVSSASAAPAPAPLLAQFPTVYYISGNLFPNGTGQLRPVFVQLGMPTDPIAKGEYAIDLLDAFGRSIQSIPFMASFVDVEGEKVDRFYFDYQIPAVKGTAQIALRHGRQVLSTIKVSANVPVVKVKSPNGGEVWRGVETIEWAAEDADGDALTFNVLYTADDGASWIPVAAALKKPSLQVDSATLPGGAKARIRVVVTDGFNTSEDDSDATFTVANKPPQPRIIQPQPDTFLAAGDTICFQAEAVDLEDGALPDSAFFWLDGQTLFGIGPKVLASLPEGDHQITLVTVDSQGLVTQAGLPVAVRPDSGVRLNAERLGDGSVRLSWPSGLKTALQSAPAVTGPFRESGLPVKIDGPTAFAVVPRASKTSFYRILIGL